MIKRIKKIWTASVARQLILGIALVHAILMSIFVFDLVSRQHEFMIEQNTAQAIGLAETLAANGSSWILANDIVGIEEVIASQSRFPGLDYAMFLDMNGKVLGYTQREKVGLYIKDGISRKLLSQKVKNTILIENSVFIDVASPVIVNAKQIGWARVGINRQDIVKNLDIVTSKGLIYTLIAISIGIIFAWFMARGLTSAIRKLTNALQQIIAGKRDIQCVIERHDEIGTLSQDFNLMLSSIRSQEEKTRKANEALFENEIKFRRLVDAMSSEYFLFSRNLSGNYTYVTHSVTSILGYDESEFKTHWFNFLTSHPKNKKALEHNQKNIEGKLQPSYEIEVFHKNGDRIWLNIAEVPVFDEQGKVISIEGIAHDISQRKYFEQVLLDKEQEQREILDNMLDGVIALDENACILTWNHAAEKLFGYSGDELIGQPFDLLFSRSAVSTLVSGGYNNNQDLNIFQRIGISKTAGSDVFLDVNAENKEGSVFPVRLSLAQLSHVENAKPRYICTCSDLTEQKYQEERLRRSQKMDALGKLTGGIAHDFNNMLGVILGYSDLLSMKTSEHPKMQKYVEEIKYAGERGKKLTQKLLGFSRRKELEAECIDINELLKDNHHMLSKVITSKIQLKYHLANDLWSAWFDKGDMEDVLVNLAINAMHAMPDGGVLTIDTKNTVLSPEQASLYSIDEGEYVYVSVTDTGLGMDEETRHQIFDPFFTTKEDFGTGLGLSQVYGFIQRSEGAINVVSEPGHGSSFIMFFPRYVMPHSGDKEIASPDTVKQEMTGNGELILLVDDEVSLLTLADEILSQSGYQVIKAESAKAALELLEQYTREGQSVALMISDVIMPVTDGYQLAKTVGERFPATRILLSSGYNDDRHIKYQDKTLHEKLLSKPYTKNELLEQVKDVLNEH